MTIIPLHEPHFINPSLHTEIEPRHVDWVRIWTVLGALTVIAAFWTGVVTAVDFIARHV